MLKRIFILLCTILLAAAILPAATLIVPTDISSIQAAIDASANGDTVLVERGTYFENLNFHGKKIIVASRYMLTGDVQDILLTVINGSSPAKPDTASCVLFVTGEDTSSVLDGFTITGGKGTVWTDHHNHNIYREGGGILTDLSSPTIRNNRIIGNDASNKAGVASCGGGGIRCSDGNPRIFNNIIMDNAGRYGGGIVLNYTGAIIRNNIIYHNTGGEDFGGSGLWAFAVGPGPKIVENNTIIENSSALDGGGVSSSGTAMTLRNNIIWGNSASEGPQISATGIGVTYCDVEGGWTGVGNINKDPFLNDSSARLESSSPCIDAGDPNALYNDKEDGTHPGFALFPSLGSVRNDMGAYGGPAALAKLYFTLHQGAPRTPRAISAYSDYQTPASVRLQWTDPDSTKSGSRLSNFRIRIYRNGVHCADVDSGVQTFTDTGLTRHQLYRYYFRTITPTDSSQMDSATAFAGGAATPASPSAFAVIDEGNGIRLYWTNPARQTDNTPLNDLAAIHIYRDGVPYDSVIQTSADTGASRSWFDPVMDFHLYSLAAVDNEEPVNTSAASAAIIGCGGFLNGYVQDFDSGAGTLYRVGGWDTTAAIAYNGRYSFTDSPAGNYTSGTTSSLLLPNIIVPEHAFFSFRDIAIVRGGAVFVEISTNHRAGYTVLKAYNWSSHPQWSDGRADSSDWFEERFDLKAYAGDTVTIRLRLTATGTLTADGWYIDAIRLAQTQAQTVTLSLRNGWNMVSIPVETEAGNVQALFPGALSRAYSFSHGYQPFDTLLRGPGYWVKMADTGHVDLVGYPVSAETIWVNPGWNMIGSINSPIDSASITTQPLGALVSRYYGYDSSYTPTRVLSPGKAYWIKSSTTAKVFLRSSGSVTTGGPGQTLRRGESIAEKKRDAGGN